MENVINEGSKWDQRVEAEAVEGPLERVTCSDPV